MDLTDLAALLILALAIGFFFATLFALIADTFLNTRTFPPKKPAEPEWDIGTDNVEQLNRTFDPNKEPPMRFRDYAEADTYLRSKGFGSLLDKTKRQLP